jgi:DNA-binding ferritin-like protein
MNINSNVNLLLGLQNQMKICHWQTKGIARHEAFGGFYDDLTPLIDDFIEQAMGKYGRFVLDEETDTIKLSNLSDIDIEGMVDTTRKALVQITDQYDAEDTDILNLRDEILGKLNKYAYLFTME